MTRKRCASALSSGPRRQVQVAPRRSTWMCQLGDVWIALALANPLGVREFALAQQTWTAQHAQEVRKIPGVHATFPMVPWAWALVEPRLVRARAVPQPRPLEAQLLVIAHPIVPLSPRLHMQTICISACISSCCWQALLAQEPCLSLAR